MTSEQPLAGPVYLGIEGGGTRTVALLADAAGGLLGRHAAGPGNLRLLTDEQLTARFQELTAGLPPAARRPAAVAIGLAGARTPADRARITRAAATVWPGVPCHPTNDLATALAAAPAPKGPAPAARVLILSGTGSCCFGRSATNGETAKVGGWGQILGDKGSGYEIGLRSLKAVVYYFDRDGAWPALGGRLLHALELNEPEDLIAWVQSAEKSAVAALAPVVFAAAEAGDRIARDILAGAVATLAADGAACAARLAAAPAPVQFVLSGSVLVRQPAFAKSVAAALRRARPGSVVTVLERESAWGAVVLARENAGTARTAEASATASAPVAAPAPPALELPDWPVGETMRHSPTEMRNPASAHLDRLPLGRAVELMLREEAGIHAPLLAESRRIARVAGWIAAAFKEGGRLFYVGAGTSGRLGVLDASECPPTFRSAPEMVQGIIAGGQSALWRAVEGAEDDAPAGARAIEFRKVTAKDVVVGITASGRTPFVWGAFAAARRAGAKTVLVAFNPHLPVPVKLRPDVMIRPNLGPEVLTGSTRLKAGTATKLLLNIFTTLAMVRLGKVAGNLMVDLNPSNVKLRDRAARIVGELRGVDHATAWAALEAAGWVVPRALAALPRRTGLFNRKARNKRKETKKKT